MAEAAPWTGSAAATATRVKVGAGNVVDRRGLPASWPRLRRRLREGGHRRRLHLHHPGDQGHRPRPGHGRHRSGGGAGRVFRGDRHLCAHLLRRRHRPRLPHDPGAGHGGGLPACWAGISARFDESPTNKVTDQRQLYEGVLGRGLATAPGTGSATTWAAQAKLSFEEGVDSYVPYAGSSAGQRGALP